MTAQLRCNGIVTELGNTDNQCPEMFLILQHETPTDARARAHDRGWRVRRRPEGSKLPVMDRCPEHSRLRNPVAR